MEQRVQNEYMAGHLPTRLKGLDEALGGGIPFGVLTELVGPPGIGKTQVCFLVLRFYFSLIVVFQFLSRYLMVGITNLLLELTYKHEK